MSKTLAEKMIDIKLKYLGQFYLLSTYNNGSVTMKQIAEYLDHMEIEISNEVAKVVEVN